MSALDSCTAARRDPVEVLLRSIVARALRGSLLTGAALGAACGGGATPRGDSTDPVGVGEGGILIPTPLPVDASLLDSRVVVVDGARGDASGSQADAGWDASALPLEAYDPCLRGPGFPVRADGLSLATPADYVAVRIASALFEEADAGVESWTRSDFALVSERGVACASATGASCENEVSHHPDQLAQAYCVQACTEWSVVTTRGDDVQRWATPADMLALLGDIDSDDDALMLAASKGYDVSCPQSGSGTLPDDSNLRYVLQTPAGRELIAIRYAETCPLVVRRFRLLATPAGELRELDHVDFPSSACVGRVPAGLQSRTQRHGDAYGDHLAQCAHLEAASVHAFVRLADELRAHGAPVGLVQRALRAADDEVRHARVVADLATQRGGVVSAARVTPVTLRSLEQIALENAVEGCVRETYGALVGAYQAERAADGELRQAMREIAADEARHAALSHDVHTWLAGVLSADANQRVRTAARAAASELARACAAEPDATLALRAGLPPAPIALAMLQQLQATLWS
jgi:hypothetical protein